MLAEHIEVLRCPHCRRELKLEVSSLRCAGGHSFDVARQGYVNLVPGGASADTAAMVAARTAVQDEGFFAPLAAALAQEIEARVPDATMVVDVGSGPGYYVQTLVGERRRGLCIDSSKHAARRAARLGPGIAAIVADVAAELPLADGRADVVLNVFAPRNPLEFRRIIAAGGLLLVAIPNQEHLAALRAQLPMLDIAADKWARLLASIEPHFELEHRQTVSWERVLNHRQLRNLVLMGPAAFHVEPGALDAQLPTVPERLAVTGVVTVASFRPR